jgi:2-oxoglutarate ferredoxin oxidoreductase subunit beta
MEHLKGLIIEAVKHEGFSLVDILQPCVSFNHVNTWDWYRERVYTVEDEYDGNDRVEAFRRSLEWGERIPIGILYRNSRTTYESLIPVLESKPLLEYSYDKNKVEELLEGFR